ncbi:MAG: PadR family transcriptional regulator, partial [Bacteroidetes bacterium]
YYTLTEIGIKVLEDLNVNWQDLVKAVNKITLKKAS